MEYFVSGSGAIADYLYGTSSATMNWYGVGYAAFASVLADESKLEIEFIDGSGNVAYSFALANPNEAGRQDEDPYSTMEPSDGYSIDEEYYPTEFAVISLFLVAGGALFIVFAYFLAKALSKTAAGQQVSPPPPLSSPRKSRLLNAGNNIECKEESASFVYSAAANSLSSFTSADRAKIQSDVGRFTQKGLIPEALSVTPTAPTATSRDALRYSTVQHEEDDEKRTRKFDKLFPPPKNSRQFSLPY
jgi:hypothetical protein